MQFLFFKGVVWSTKAHQHRGMAVVRGWLREKMVTHTRKMRMNHAWKANRKQHFMNIWKFTILRRNPFFEKVYIITSWMHSCFTMPYGVCPIYTAGPSLNLDHEHFPFIQNSNTPVPDGSVDYISQLIKKSIPRNQPLRTKPHSWNTGTKDIESVVLGHRLPRVVFGRYSVFIEWWAIGKQHS